jgi:hypothetical protein
MDTVVRFVVVMFGARNLAAVGRRAADLLYEGLIQYHYDVATNMSLLSQAQEYRATLALLFVGTIAGFFAGRLSIPAPTPSPKEEPSPPPVPAKDSEKEKAPIQTTDSDWEDEAQGELSEFPGINEECKLVLVVRTDLGMTKGTLLPLPFSKYQL